MNPYIELAMNTGAFGLVAWLVYHTFKHTIPRLVKDFKDTIEEQRKDFREELRLEREDFKIALESLGNKIDKLTKVINEMET